MTQSHPIRYTGVDRKLWVERRVCSPSLPSYKGVSDTRDRVSVCWGSGETQTNSPSQVSKKLFVVDLSGSWFSRSEDEGGRKGLVRGTDLIDGSPTIRP